MVNDTTGLLKELKRILKPEGKLILEDGHQPREKSRQKVLNSGFWEIVGENKKHMTCKPIFGK